MELVDIDEDNIIPYPPLPHATTVLTDLAVDRESLFDKEYFDFTQVYNYPI